MAKFSNQTRVFPNYNESFDVTDNDRSGYVDEVDRDTYSLASSLVLRISQKSGGPDDTTSNSHTVSYYEGADPVEVAPGGPYSVSGDTTATMPGRAQVVVADAADLSFGNGVTNSPFTFSLWVKSDWTAAAGGTNFVGPTFFYKTDEYWAYRVHGAGVQDIVFRLYNAASGIWAAFTFRPNLIDNEWINLTFTYDGQTDSDSLELFVNGVFEAPTSVSISSDVMTAGSQPLTFGGYGATAAYGDFVGEMSDIFLFNKPSAAVL